VGLLVGAKDPVPPRKLPLLGILPRPEFGDKRGVPGMPLGIQLTVKLVLTALKILYLSGLSENGTTLIGQTLASSMDGICP